MNRTTALLLAASVILPGALLAADKMDFGRLDLSKLPKPSEKNDVSFAKDIQPMFEASCVRCHGEDRPKGGLRLNSIEGVLHGGKDGKVLVAGDSARSLLVIAAAQIDEESAMPPKRGPGRRPPGGPGGPAAPGNPGGVPREFSGGPNGGPNSNHGGGPTPGPRGGPGGFGPPPKPLTPEQVGLVRHGLIKARSKS